MCGELDDSVLINQEILERFNAMARKLGVEPAPGDASAPEGLSSAAGRGRYMDRLFADNLGRALADVTAANEAEVVDAIASQAIAFARLAGFIAGQLPPEADLFRSLIEAMSEGHSEPRRLMDAHRRQHDHHHGHGHDHH